MAGVLIIPGLNGSGSAHWQSRWQRRLGGAARRVHPASWQDPEAGDWMEAVEREIDGPCVAVAHSLGCLAVTQWLARGSAATREMRALFLVAPPDAHAPGFPKAIRGFEVARERLPRPAVIVASEDDPFATMERTRRLGSIWGVPVIDVGAKGHINVDSGVGAWPEGWNLLEAFLAGARLSRLLGGRARAASSLRG